MIASLVFFLVTPAEAGVHVPVGGSGFQIVLFVGCLDALGSRLSPG
jgi:hypothetical protein